MDRSASRPHHSGADGWDWSRAHAMPARCRARPWKEIEVCPLSARADIYFPLYVPPLRRVAQSANHLLKGIGVFRRVLEPSQEVEWLSKFSAVMQTSRYGRQVFHTNSNVPRLLLEDGSAFILR